VSLRFLHLAKVISVLNTDAPVVKDTIPFLPRQPRIGTNTRNGSHSVFAFGNNLDYPDVSNVTFIMLEKERYICNAACAYEASKSIASKAKQLDRNAFKM
jgi:hypothetical protein